MIDLINALSTALYGLYPNKEIYIEDIEQNFVPGTFFIAPLASTNDGAMNNRRYRAYSYDVMYYPASDTEPMNECVNMGEVLRDAFEVIEYDSVKIKSRDLSTRIVDKVLHVELSFDIYIDKAHVDVLMDGMDIDIGVE